MADKDTESAVVGGVDTHKDLHVAAVVDENNKVLGTRYFSTTRQGYRQMQAWTTSFGAFKRLVLNVKAPMDQVSFAICRMQVWKFLK